MNSLFELLFTSSWLLLVLMLGYLIFLQNQKLLIFNRLYLLASLLLCLFHPLLPKIWSLFPDVGGALAFSQKDWYLPEIILSPQQGASATSGLSIAMGLYLAVGGFMLLRYLLQLLKLRKILTRQGFTTTPEGFLLAHTEGSQPAFSFFRYLVINKTHAETEEEYQLVLQHEKAHARQHHSADVLLAELVKILLWFHPGIYLLNKALRQTHEHLADAAVIQNQHTESTYITLMAKQGLTAAGLPFVSTFFQSLTINRIRMIKKSTPTTWPWRIAASLLLAASLTAFVACEKQEEDFVAPPPPPAHAPDAPAAKAISEQDAAGIYDVTEEEALPLGGLQAFYQHLGENITYPQEAMAAGVEGTAYIRFVIDEKGNVISAESIKERRLGYGLDEEAIRVVNTTKWIPAKQGGKTVKQRKVLPIKFKL